MEFINQYFLNIVKNNYANFNGRARRKEYWMFTLCSVILFTILIILIAIMGSIANFLGVIFYIIYMIAAIGLIVPSIAVTVRRMHDVNKDWWYMIIPIYNIILTIQEGDHGDNQYGPDPKAEERA